MKTRIKIPFIIFLWIFLIFLLQLGFILYDYYNENRKYEELNASVASVAETDVSTEEDETEAPEEPPKEWAGAISVDFEELRSINPEIVGWIFFENETISYPILYSGDNEKYLTTLYDGEKGNAGAIFLDGNGQGDFSDSHTLIYGHNMRDLTMFGKLKYYNQKEDYYSEHKYFQIHTEDKIQRYEIFATHTVHETYDIHPVPQGDNDALQALMKKLQSKSNMLSSVDLSGNPKVVTLCTCSFDEYRFLVHGVMVDESSVVE